MRSRNICKFSPASANDGFSTQQFILETNPETMMKKFPLSCYRLVLMIHGSARIFSAPREAGTLIFCFQGETFCAEPLEPCEYMYIDFSGIRADDLFRRFDIHPNNRSFPDFDGLIPLWQESLSRASDRTVDLAAESMLLYSFSRLSPNLSAKNILISQIEELSEKQFTDPQLTIASIAEELGYNAKYLSHVFSEKKGISYSEYLRSLRLKHAVLLMDHGIDSVKNVSLLSGFNDPLYFSTVFKKSTGISPKEYMARIQEESQQQQ